MIEKKKIVCETCKFKINGVCGNVKLGDYLGFEFPVADLTECSEWINKKDKRCIDCKFGKSGSCLNVYKAGVENDKLILNLVTVDNKACDRFEE
jgi:hypothetical protein